MAARRLQRLGFEDFINDRLKRQNFRTCKDVLSKTPVELLKLLALSHFSVQRVVRVASEAAAPKPSTALQLWEKRQSKHAAYIATSLESLDQVLHGGFPAGTVTEIAGPSGCGKTQFCLMLSVIATLPSAHGGLDGAVLYLDTESTFSAERFVEIAQSRYPQVFGEEEVLLKALASVHIYSENTCAGLLQRLENLEEDLISKGIRLVIIDSMASLIRKEFDSRGSKSVIESTNLLTRQAAILKYLAEEFEIPIVVTNQITTRFGRSATPSDDGDVARSGDDVESLRSFDGDGSYVTAALGNTWSHSVNSRIILQYLNGPQRQVLIAKSPIAPFANFVYTIQASGLVLEEGGADHYEGTDPGQQHIRVRSALPYGAAAFHST